MLSGTGLPGGATRTRPAARAARASGALNGGCGELEAVRRGVSGRASARAAGFFCCAFSFASSSAIRGFQLLDVCAKLRVLFREIGGRLRRLSGGGDGEDQHAQ